MGEAPKRIIITGATDGLGLRLAWLFAAQNTDLILTGRRRYSELTNNLPKGAHYIVADQSNPDCADVIKAEINRMGWPHIDNLILNAGSGQFVDPVQEQSGRLRKTITVNLVAPVTIIRELARDFIQNNSAPDEPLRSCVTIIGSTSAKGAENFASYAASKAGLSGFARALTSEWRDRIDVQIIHPGPTDTAMQKKAGLEVGFARRFFVDPDFSASRIVTLINNRKQIATIGITQNIIWQITHKLGLSANITRFGGQ